MERKGLIMGMAAVASTVAVCAVLLSKAELGNGFTARATGNDTWYHYAAVEATATRHGSREFWANSSNSCATHQFTDPGEACVERDFADNPHFYELTSEDDRYVAPTSSAPVFSNAGKTVTYGLYPQTVINDGELAASLGQDAVLQANGWYRYRGEYYAKATANPYDDYTFDNGAAIEENADYWFKCDPITWSVLSDAGAECYLLSDVLLDAHRYHSDSSNYENSEIRSWLNGAFHNLAFSLGDDYVKATVIDGNTRDKVFLPSLEDYKSPEYGFIAEDTTIGIPPVASNSSRLCQTTDWARVRGAECDENHNGFYWTRTSYSDDYQRAIRDTGAVGTRATSLDEECARPAITLVKDPGDVAELSLDGQTVTYGLYPQTNVNDASLLTALNALESPESNGWYLHEGEYYAKVTAAPQSDYAFDNGTKIKSGTTYWFRCEPIVWNVLSKSGNEHYLLSSLLLDSHAFAPSSNNYADSSLRVWLNGGFYNSAFSLGDGYIKTTTVDNSAPTTDSEDNPYKSDNTNDKVFLPSYQDYLNSSYGFSTSAAASDTRTCKTTDWVRAVGSWCNKSTYNGYYWTRSPKSDSSSYAWRVYSDGQLDGNLITGSNANSVRPAITITLL